jgi:hypothetical protein
MICNSIRIKNPGERKKEHTESWIDSGVLGVSSTLGTYNALSWDTTI